LRWQNIRNGSWTNPLGASLQSLCLHSQHCSCLCFVSFGLLSLASAWWLQLESNYLENWQELVTAEARRANYVRTLSMNEDSLSLSSIAFPPRCQRTTKVVNCQLLLTEKRCQKDSDVPIRFSRAMSECPRLKTAGINMLSARLPGFSII
jgi:hypothetical protein